MQLREAFPAFEQLGVAVAGVVGQAPAKVGQYLSAHPLPFPLLPDPERDVIKAYGVYHFIGIDAYNIARPSVFLIDRDRVVRYLYVSDNQLDRPDPKEIVRESAKLG